jgi:DNA invertase Pin-like site-specific DNA recombinase
MPQAIAYTRASVAYPPPVSEQLKNLSTYATDHDLTISASLSDAAPPASKNVRRPGFESLIRIIEEGKTHAVLVTSLNLVGRSLPELLTILGKAAERGIRVIALDEGIDTGATMPVAAMLGALNRHQKFLRREGAIVGQQAAKAAGVRFGRPTISEAKVTKAREALAKGAGIRPAARIAGISPAKAHEILKAMKAGDAVPA